MGKRKCKCPIYCTYCGAKLKCDAIGHYCGTKNCQWQYSANNCMVGLYRLLKPKENEK